MKLTYSIPEANIDVLMNKIEKTNRRARRAGLQESTISIVGSETKTLPLLGSDTTIKMVVHTVEIEVGFQSFEGWRLVAVLEPISNTEKNVVLNVPGEEMPEMYRTRFVCDHCGIDRKRNRTFVIRHEKSGETMQVGSTCLQSFLPGCGLAEYAEGLEEVLAAAESSQELEDDFFEGEEGRKYAFFDTAEFLAMVMATIAKHGWVSQSAAQAQGKVSTVDTVLEAIFSKYQNEKIAVSDKEIAEAKEMLTKAGELLAAKRRLTDYEYNLLNCVTTDLVQFNQVGILASLPAYLGHEVVKSQTDGEHLGSVGDKLTCKVTVNWVIAQESYYGRILIVNMTDDQGNMLVWFAPATATLKAGDEVTITGTVKAHNYFNGKPQTVLTRCKVC